MQTPQDRAPWPGPISMNVSTRSVSIEGPVGRIDLALDFPAGPARAVAVVAHPHPLMGGTRDNKVVQTMTRALLSLGVICWRPNFRGVGESEGTHDEGRGETEDLLAVVDHAQADAAQRRDRAEMALTPSASCPLILAGFSFGSFVQSRVAARLATAGHAPSGVLLVGTAVSRFDMGVVQPGTVVIHGELDEVVPLSSVLDWARPQDLPVIVMPGAEHFFHRKLTVLKTLVAQQMAGVLARTDG